VVSLNVKVIDGHGDNFDVTVYFHTNNVIPVIGMYLCSKLHDSVHECGGQGIICC